LQTAPAHLLLCSADCALPFPVELRVNLCSLLGIVVLEGSCVDEPFDKRDELCPDKILVTLFLIEHRKNVIEDVVETTAFATTMWSGEGSGPAKSRLNSCYGSTSSP
jgi:hypothetical protein